MTQELSKQICEICGIQTRGKLIFHKRNWDDKSYISCGRGYKEFDFKSCPNVTVDILPDNLWEEKMGWQYPYKQIEEIKQLYNKNGYDFVEFKTETIDFGQPENFVKLLEIISRKATVLFSHNGVYFGCSIHYGFDEIFEAVKGSLAKNFLNTLTLLNTYYPKLLELEEIKQAIREAEWKYE